MPGKIKGSEGRVPVRRDVAGIDYDGIDERDAAVLAHDEASRHGAQGLGQSTWTQVRYWARREGLTEEGRGYAEGYESRSGW